MKKTIIIALLVALISAGAGFGSCYAVIKSNPGIIGIYNSDADRNSTDYDSEKSKGTNRKNDSSVKDSDSDNLPKTAELKVGDSVTIGDFKYTFVSYNGHAHEADSDGKRGIRMEVQVENVSNKVSCSRLALSNDWYIDNNIIEVNSCYDIKNDDDRNFEVWQNMTPGQKASAIVYYDIDANAKNVKLVTSVYNEDKEKSPITFICEK